MLIGAAGFLVYKSHNTKATTNSTTAKSVATGPYTGWAQYTSKVGGFSLKYPKDWTASGINSNPSDDSLNENSTSVQLFSPTTENQGTCVVLDVLQNGQSTTSETVSSSEEVADLGSGLKVYQIKETWRTPTYANLVVTDNGTSSVMKLANGNSLSSTAGYDCNQNSLDILKLTYDQQIAANDYKQALQILKSIQLTN